MSVEHQQIIWSLLGSLAVLLGVLASYLRTRTSQRRRHAENTTRLENVQTTVNGATEVLHQRVEQLTEALKAAGVELPDEKRRDT